MTQDNNYIGRAIAVGIRNKRRAPFEAPARARLTKAIDTLYKKTPGAHTGTSRNALFDVRYVLADGSTAYDFTAASKAVQDRQTVRVQLWECVREARSWWQTDNGRDDAGEYRMRAERDAAMTAAEFERHAR